MKIIIPSKFCQPKGYSFKLLRDKKLQEELKKICSNPEAEYVFNIDGTYGEGIRKDVHLNNLFLKYLPPNMKYTFNISNFDYFSTDVSNYWELGRMKNLSLNFKNVNLLLFSVMDSIHNDKNNIENLSISTNNCDVRYSFKTNIIKNLIISNANTLLDKKGHIRLENVCGCECIDLSNFKNLENITLWFTMADKNTKWKLPKSITIDSLTRESFYPPAYSNVLKFKKADVEAQTLSTLDLKTKFFKPKSQTNSTYHR